LNFEFIENLTDPSRSLAFGLSLQA